jgi:AraC family transcriptional regulator
MTTPAIGDFVAWDGGCLFIGSRAGLVPPHAHYAIQIAFGSTPGIRFRGDEQEEWRSYTGAIVPSRQPHSMDATPLEYWAVLFVEPETLEGRVLAERYLQGGITALPADLVESRGAELFRMWLQERTTTGVIDAARQLVGSLTGGVGPHASPDPRILRATAYIREHIDQPLTLEAVAGEAFLSPSRFRHLFVEQTGMALRQYILWRRFLRVWELMMAGASLSSAAHRAGFADAAHLSRTSRRMFGITPSSLQRPGILHR